MPNISVTTPASLTREYLPEFGQMQRFAILWQLTAFPCCDVPTLRQQLADIRAKLDAGIGIPQQMKDADAAMDEAMELYEEKENDQ